MTLSFKSSCKGEKIEDIKAEKQKNSANIIKVGGFLSLNLNLTNPKSINTKTAMSKIFTPLIPMGTLIN